MPYSANGSNNNNCSSYPYLSVGAGVILSRGEDDDYVDDDDVETDDEDEIISGKGELNVSLFIPDNWTLQRPWLDEDDPSSLFSSGNLKILWFMFTHLFYSSV